MCPHPTHFASDLLHRRLRRSQDVADVTAVLPTAVVEAGHVRALVGSSRSGFLES